MFAALAPCIAEPEMQLLRWNSGIRIFLGMESYFTKYYPHIIRMCCCNTYKIIAEQEVIT